MLNRVILEGRFTQDPEGTVINKDNFVSNFALAVNRSFKVEGQADVDFINCTAWNKLADNICQYCKKGSLVSVEGRLQVRSYDDSEGKKRYVSDVIVERINFISTPQEREEQAKKQWNKKK